MFGTCSAVDSLQSVSLSKSRKPRVWDEKRLGRPYRHFFKLTLARINAGRILREKGNCKLSNRAVTVNQSINQSINQSLLRLPQNRNTNNQDD